MDQNVDKLITTVAATGNAFLGGRTEYRVYEDAQTTNKVNRFFIAGVHRDCSVPMRLHAAGMFRRHEAIQLATFLATGV